MLNLQKMDDEDSSQPNAMYFTASDGRWKILQKTLQ